MRSLFLHYTSLRKESSGSDAVHIFFILVSYYSRMGFLDFALDILFPPRCVSCGADTPDKEVAACEECVRKISIHTSLFCGKCRLRLANNRRVCHRSFPYLLGAAAEYESPLTSLPKDLVLALKFKYIRSASLPLEDMLIAYLDRLALSFPSSTLVIPMPLSKRRLRTRGYNQAELLARAVAAHLGFPMDKESLVRIKHTPPQSELDFESRKANVENVFGVRREADLRGRTVILVDDVATSGSTFFEASRALKSAGVRSILALAAAKA